MAGQGRFPSVEPYVLPEHEAFGRGELGAELGEALVGVCVRLEPGGLVPREELEMRPELLGAVEDGVRREREEVGVPAAAVLSRQQPGVVRVVELPPVFRPALAARDAIEQKNWNIPDGFYLVGNSVNPTPDFQKAIIDAVEKVTHIAPADDSSKLIGVPLEQFGVINYAARDLGLCMGLTDAKYMTTTEVYPDSPKSDDENCTLAQVASITGGLDYILENL